MHIYCILMPYTTPTLFLDAVSHVLLFTFSLHFFAPSLFIHTHKHTYTLGKLTGWHTAVLNISGSFLLGAVYAVPTIETKTHPTTNTKITSQYPSWINLIRDPWGRIQQGITPRTKLMWGVGFCGRYAVDRVNTTISLFSNDAFAVLDSHGRLIRSGLCCCCRSFLFHLWSFFIFSYTTFSTFSYDVITWISQGHVSRAVSYVAINNVCSIGAAGLGMLAMKKILQHTIIK